jgi:post-segregation antitoxin (ccd killing protein)
MPELEEYVTTRPVVTVACNKYGMVNRIMSFRIPLSLRESLIDYCKKEDLDVSYVVRHAIAEYLRRHKKSRIENFTTKNDGWAAKSEKID